VLVPQPPILDSVSEVVCSLSHQRGKQQKTNQTDKQKKQTTTKKTKNSKFKWNFNPSASNSTSVIALSKEVKIKSVWRQFCESLSEAVAHLPAAVSLLLLEALFMQISGVSLTLT
jgi:hypothetical protein